MAIAPVASTFAALDAGRAASPKPPNAKADDGKLRQTFDAFVGETLFGQMLKQMRKSVSKTPYFHGGRTEEVFQQQLDQVIAEKMSRSSADKLTGPMYELFTLNRK
jgi:peptidoglycan hydrolase FlgJ